MVFVGIVLLVLALDQLTKFYMRENLVAGEPISWIPGILRLNLVYNTGAAFSLGSGMTVLFIVIALLCFIICTALVWRYAYKENRFSRAFCGVLGCVAGGGISNAIDRVFLPGVTDFFEPVFIHFAVFNVADAAITLGVIVAALLWVLHEAR